MTAQTPTTEPPEEERLARETLEAINVVLARVRVCSLDGKPTTPSAPVMLEILPLLRTAVERAEEARDERREAELAAAMRTNPDKCPDCPSGFMCWAHSRISEAFDPRLSTHPWLGDVRAAVEKAEKERDEARATKDLHKERQEQEIERAMKAEKELRTMMAKWNEDLRDFIVPAASARVKEELEGLAAKECYWCDPAKPSPPHDVDEIVEPAELRDGAWWHPVRFRDGGWARWSLCKAAKVHDRLAAIEKEQ